MSKTTKEAEYETKKRKRQARLDRSEKGTKKKALEKAEADGSWTGAPPVFLSLCLCTKTRQRTKTVVVALSRLAGPEYRGWSGGSTTLQEPFSFSTVAYMLKHDAGRVGTYYTGRARRIGCSVGWRTTGLAISDVSELDGVWRHGCERSQWLDNGPAAKRAAADGGWTA